MMPATREEGIKAAQQAVQQSRYARKPKTFDEFSARARALHPDASEQQIREAWAAKYGGTGIRTRGPSRDDYAKRARELYPDASDDEIEQAYEAKYGAGFLKETGRTLLRQAYAPVVGGIGDILGGMDRLASGVPGTGLFDELGQALHEHAGRVQEANLPSADVGTRSPWNPYALTQNVLGGLGQVAGAVATGGASLAPLTGQDAGAVATELEDQGYSESAARARAIPYALASALLERLGIGRLIPKRLPGRIAAGLQEGSTEVAQNVARNVATNDPALEDLSRSIAGEGLPAGLAASILAPGRQRGAATAEERFKEEAGLEVPRGEQSTGATKTNLPLRPTEQAWATELPGLPRGFYEALSGFAPANLGAETKGQLQELRQRISEAGEAPAEAVRAVFGPELANAPPGLRQALDSAVALSEVSPGDTPSREPLADLRAQVAELGRSRRGVLVPKGQEEGFKDLPGVDLPTGRMVVQSPAEAAIFEAEFAANDPQQVIGTWTGAGLGKPTDPDAVVVQAYRGDQVIRESAVPQAEAQQTAERFAGELGARVRIVTPAEALARRQDLLKGEASAFAGLSERELLRRTNPKAYNKKYIDTQPLPKLGAMPKDAGAYFAPSATSATVPMGALVETKKQPGSTTASLKRMAASLTGETDKRGPISVRVDKAGRLLIQDGNGTVRAARVAGLQDVEAELELELADEKFREYERALTGAVKADIAAQARDAAAYQPELNRGVEEIAQQLGATPKPGTVKAEHGYGRIAEKIMLEKNGVPDIKDMARATILVKTPAQAKAALGAVVARWGQAPGTTPRDTLLTADSLQEVLARDPYGYADIKVNVAAPNGRAYEIQIAFDEIAAVKEKRGHKLYEDGRTREGKVVAALRKIYGRKGLSTDEFKRAMHAAERMFRDRDPEMQKIYQQSRSLYGPALSRWFTSLSKSAAEISTPSARMPEGVTNDQVPSAPMSPAPVPAITAGAPSTVQKVEPAGQSVDALPFMPTTSSAPIVAESVQESTDPANTYQGHLISIPSSGRQLRARPRVVELDSLIASDNPAYPQALQPRARGERVALNQQVRDIAARLDPNLLGVSRSTADGAPIVSWRGVVESGNGRVMALRVARDQYPEKWAQYQAWLQAEGHDTAGMTSPVLVQERTTPMSQGELEAYTAEANARPNAAMSATERAKADARLVDESVLTTVSSGDMSQAQNVDALKGFFARLPPNELNDLVDKRGLPNAEGQRRAEAALVAKAYGNADGIDALLERLYETQDEGVRRITNALRLAAYKMGTLRLAIDTGRVGPEYDIAPDLIRVYNQIRLAREGGRSIEEMRGQGELMKGQHHDALLRLIYTDKNRERDQETIASELIYYAQNAAQQRVDQASLFSAVIPPSAILEAAEKTIGGGKMTPNDATRFARAGSVKRGKMERWDVHLAVMPIRHKWGEGAPGVVIVQDPGELPATIVSALGTEINGATDLNTGIVYLVADNIANPFEAQRVLLHEAVGHYGFARLYGDQFPKMVDDVLRLGNSDATIRKIAAEVDRKYGRLERNTRAAEIIAHLAESNPRHNFAQRALAAFRALLRKMGFTVNLSKNDLVRMLRRSADALMESNRMDTDRSLPVLRGAEQMARVSEERDLIAQHNLSEANLRHALRRYDGQIPVPSIAVTKVDFPMHGFGEITLLGDADLIDPRGPNRTQVFGADIYSPRHPRVKRSFRASGLNKLNAKLKANWQEILGSHWVDEKELQEPGGNMNPWLIAEFLVSEGHATADEIRAAVQARAPDKSGLGMTGVMGRFMRERVNDPVLDQWVTKLGESLPGTDKFFEGYDASGDSRYRKATLENIVRVMKRNLRGGETGGLVYGAGQMRAHIAPRFTSRRAITAAKSNLLPAFHMEEIKKRVDAELLGLAQELDPNSDGASSAVMEFLLDAAQRGLPNAERGQFAEFVDAPLVPEMRARVRDFLNSLRDLPSEYFEAKVMGPVGLDKFKVAVVPDTLAQDLVQELERRGLEVWKYDQARGRPSKDYKITEAAMAHEHAGVLFASRTDKYGRPLNEVGLPLDQVGRYIPAGQQEMLEDLPAPKEPEAPPALELTAPEGQVRTPAQGRLFASRPTGQSFQGPPPGVNRPTAAPAAPRPERQDVGGGSYSLKQFGRLNDQELKVMTSVMDNLEAPVEGQRRGTRTWTNTEAAAVKMLQDKYGLTLDSLVNRKPGRAANAEQLEAYGMMLVAQTREIEAVGKRIAGTRNPSSDDLAKLAELREKLGVMIAPAMGYRTEAGRSLNILRKMAGEFKQADDVLAELGDGSENVLKDFAKRVADAGSIDKVLGVTRASYTPTMWDKFYEYWINGILSGPTTHSVNMVSNAIFQALESAAGFVAAAGSKDVHAAAEMARLAAIPHGVTLGLANGKTAFLEEHAILTPEDKLETNRRAIGGDLGRVVRLPGRALQAEDEFFKAVAYQGQLAALAMERAIGNRPENPRAEFDRIMGNILAHPDLIAAAKKQAARVTFTTPLGPRMRALNDALVKSKVGKLIVPFVRTPTNILLEATKYTPAAPLLPSVRAELAGGGRDAALGYSRMAVGSSVMLAFVALAAQGMLSGAGPDDDATRAQLMRQGWRPYSIRMPDGSWLKYNRFEPFGMLTGLAADLFEIGASMKEGDYSAAASMLMTSLANNLGDKTFLRGVTEFAQAYADPKRYLDRWAKGMGSSLVPNAVAQTARWLDPYQRQANSLVEHYRAKIPGMSEDMAARLDFAGEPIQRDTGMPGNPMSASEPKQDPLAKAMIELGVRKNAPSNQVTVGGNSYKLEGETFNSYKQFIQGARYRVLTPLVSSPQFQEVARTNPIAAQQILEKHWDNIGREARVAWLYQNIGALGAPKRAPGGRDLAQSYVIN